MKTKSPFDPSALRAKLAALEEADATIRAAREQFTALQDEQNTVAASADPNDEVAIEDAVRRRARLDLFPAHIAKLEHNLKPLLTETYAELEHFRHAYETELAREREALLDEIEKLTKRYSPDREERNGEIINVARNLAAQHGIFAVLRNQFERADGYASATSPAFTLAEAASANLRLHDEWKRGGQSFVPPDFFAAR